MSSSSSTTRRPAAWRGSSPCPGASSRPLEDRRSPIASSRIGRLTESLVRSGFRLRSVHRHFVLPIALHKAIELASIHPDGRGLARPARPAAPLRIAGDGRGRTVRALVTGATGFTGGHLVDTLTRRGWKVRALVRDPARAADLGRAGVELVPGDLREPRRPGGRHARRRRRVSHRRRLPPGRRPEGDLSRGERDGRPRADRGGGRATACVVWCTAARSACTATSSIRPRTRTRRSVLATSTRSRSSRESGSHGRRRKRSGIEVVIVRPTGIYGPGDRRLLKLFRGVARQPVPDPGTRPDLLPSDLHRRSGGWADSVRDAPGRGQSHLHSRGR